MWRTLLFEIRRFGLVSNKAKPLEIEERSGGESERCSFGRTFIAVEKLTNRKTRRVNSSGSVSIIIVVTVVHVGRAFEEPRDVMLEHRQRHVEVLQHADHGVMLFHGPFGSFQRSLRIERTAAYVRTTKTRVIAVVNTDCSGGTGRRVETFISVTSPAKARGDAVMVETENTARFRFL